jgi:hypothetical protein
MRKYAPEGGGVLFGAAFFEGADGGTLPPLPNAAMGIISIARKRKTASRNVPLFESIIFLHLSFGIHKLNLQIHNLLIIFLEKQNNP